MICEIAEIYVIAGNEAAFEAGAAGAAPYSEAARGCRSFALTRGIAHPQHYRLTIERDSVEGHMVHFRESAAFQTWRDLVGPDFANPPSVEHVQSVIEGF